jgi:hypothetical protein
MINKINKEKRRSLVAFNERNPNMTKQQELVARNPDGPKQNQDKAQGRARRG